MDPPFYLLLVSVALLQLSQTCSGQSGVDPTSLLRDTTTGMDYDMDNMSTTTMMGSGCPLLTDEGFTVTTRPEALINSSGNVVEGSVIQIYCSVETDNEKCLPISSHGISFTWTLNESTLLNDPPHVRIRTNVDGTHITSVLTVDNFRDIDNGIYRCNATRTTSSKSLSNERPVTLTAMNSVLNGRLMIVSEPSNFEPVDVNAILNDNRTGIGLGDNVDGSLLTCIAGHQGDGMMNYSLPSVVWVMNGQPVDVADSRINVTSTAMANGRLSSSLTITNFTLTDAGVYQCVFTDSDGDTELITTVPYRLDTGNTVVIERVSPDVIILRPPEKLVIEVSTSGEYQVHFWNKDETQFGISGKFRVMFPNEFPNFFEIFVRDNTTDNDLGIYRVRPRLGDNFQHTVLPGTSGINFAVIAPEDANTTVLTNLTIDILEGGNANISCRSVGAPTPTITWILNNQVVSFEQTDRVIQFEATLSGTVPNVTPGNIISTLHIVNASHLDDSGVYTCVGTNSNDITVASSSVSINVQVQCIEQYLENCTVPEPNTTSPNSEPTHTTDFDLARQRGMCYAMCANGSSLPVSDQQKLPGYHLWLLATKSFIFSDDGLTIDCLEGGSSDYNGCSDVFTGCSRFNSAYRKILDCERGCLLKFSQPTLPVTGTGGCDTRCRSDCRQNPVTGCGGVLFGGGRCFSGTVPPCGLDCKKGDCERGCQLAQNKIDDSGIQYPEEANPILPPSVRLVTGSCKRYVINITESVPTSTRRLGFSTLVVKVEDLTQHCVPAEPVYFVLDEGYEFNLQAFLCRKVNISYAVATEQDDMSAFSAPVTVEVREGDADLFPGQLDTFNFTVSIDPDTFQYHIIELQWELPQRPQSVDSYAIFLRSTGLCGHFETLVTDPFATSYTIRNTEPYDPNNPVPPLTECSYTTEIEVRPGCPDDEDPPVIEILTGQYPLPSNDDFTLSCTRDVNIYTGNNYDISIRLELNDQFTSAYRDAIAYFFVAITPYNTLGPLNPIGIPIGEDRLRVNSTFLEAERTYINIPARENDEEYYRITAHVFYNPVRTRKGRFTECILRDVGPVLPGNVTSIQYRIIGEPEESYASGKRNVFVINNITWEAPTLKGAGITFYDIRLGREPREIDDTAPVTTGDTVTQQAANGLYVSVKFRYLDVPAGNLTLYLQVRAGIRTNDPGIWNEPIEVNVTVFDPPQPATMGNDDFNVTSLSYRINHPDDKVDVTVKMEFVSPAITFGMINQYDLWVGDRVLAPDEEPLFNLQIAPTNVTVQTADRTVAFSLLKFQAGVSAFVQMRANTVFSGSSLSRRGNWSEAEEMPITIIPAPIDIQVQSVRVEPEFRADKILLNFIIDVQWSPGASRKRQTSLTPTGYQVALGTEPIEVPFGEVPMDTAREQFITTSERFTDSLTFDREESVSNLTVYLQIRSFTDATQDGAWSEPIKIPVEDIKCRTLPVPDNGRILYAPDTTPDYDVGTLATYVCNSGYTLGGSYSQVCVFERTVSKWNRETEPPPCLQTNLLVISATLGTITFIILLTIIIVIVIIFVRRKSKHLSEEQETHREGEHIYDDPDMFRFCQPALPDRNMSMGENKAYEKTFEMMENKAYSKGVPTSESEIRESEPSCEVSEIQDQSEIDSVTGPVDKDGYLIIVP